MEMKLVDRQSYGEVFISGRIDSKNSKDVQNALMNIGDRFDNVTLNLTDLKYISSAGLRAVKNLYIKLRGKGGELFITNPAPFVLQVFEMTGFSEMLNIQ